MNDPSSTPAALLPQFDAPSFDAWWALLKAAFGLPLSESELATYKLLTGRTTPTKARELWWISGRRAGKSIIAALVSVYLATTRTYKLAPGSGGPRPRHEKATRNSSGHLRQRTRVRCRCSNHRSRGSVRRPHPRAPARSHTSARTAPPIPPLPGRRASREDPECTLPRIARAIDPAADLHFRPRAGQARGEAPAARAGGPSAYTRRVCRYEHARPGPEAGRTPHRTVGVQFADALSVSLQERSEGGGGVGHPGQHPAPGPWDHRAQREPGSPGAAGSSRASPMRRARKRRTGSLDSRYPESRPDFSLWGGRRTSHGSAHSLPKTKDPRSTSVLPRSAARHHQGCMTTSFFVLASPFASSSSSFSVTAASMKLTPDVR